MKNLLPTLFASTISPGSFTPTKTSNGSHVYISMELRKLSLQFWLSERYKRWKVFLSSKLDDQVSRSECHYSNAALYAGQHIQYNIEGTMLTWCHPRTWAEGWQCLLDKKDCFMSCNRSEISHICRTWNSINHNSTTPMLRMLHTIINAMIAHA